jgi:Leucine-rich repeat (LRR) protein
MKKHLLFLLVSFLFIANSFGQLQPTITSFLPTTAGPDDTVTITGSNFSGLSQVRFGGAPVYFTAVSSTTIKAVIGAYTGSGSVSVVTGSDTATLPGYTWNGYPVITSVIPISAHAGDTVIITGKYIAPSALGPSAPMQLTFGGVAPASVAAPSFTELKAVIASGGGSGDIFINTGFGTNTYHGFTFLPSGSLTQDSLALVDLYNSTNGAGWTNHTNWLTAAPLSTWYGVIVEGGRVIQLNLTGNNLTGFIPASLGNATALEGIVLIDNKLTGLIPSSLNNLVNLTGVQLEDNYYTFDGLEGLSTTRFSYNSQRTVLTIHNNNNLLSVSAGGTLSNNTYTWYRYDSGNVVIATKPHDSTLLATASGIYYVQVDNALTPDADFFSDTLRVSLLPIVVDPLTQDSLALVDFYNSTNGSGWTQNTNWLTAAPLSTWYGVSIQNGRVSGLSLNNNNLVGNIPTSFGNLSQLAFVALRNNKLSGNIPSSFSNLSLISDLELGNNQLSGNLYPLGPVLVNSFGVDTSLYNNYFTFTSFENIIDTIKNVLGNNDVTIKNAISPQANLQLNLNTYTHSLSVFAGGTLSNNTYKWYNGGALAGTTAGDSTFTITVPGNYSVVVNNVIVPQLTLFTDTLNIATVPNWQDSLIVDSLALVDLYNRTNGVGWTHNDNWLTSAPLDEWYGVEIENGRVGILELPSNNLVGSLPSSLGNLTGLVQLILESNQLNGSIPASLSDLSNLIEFGLADNYFTGIVPPTLNNLSCNYLELDDNEFNFDALERKTPKETFGGQKTILQINNNNGTLSVTAGGTLSNNTYTWYNNDNSGVATITGDSTFTPILSGDYKVYVNNSIATTTTLYSNDLYIVVAPSISQDSLALVDLYNATNGAGWINNTNWLTTAPVSSWWGVTVQSGRVTQVILPSNNLNGTIPSSLGNVTDLTTLDVRINELSGGIPSSLGSLSNLTYLVLDSNQLGGNIPSSLGSLSNLLTLQLTNDLLTGEIPASLGSLSELTDLDLSSNQLTGNIPSSLSGLSAITILSLNNNQLSGAIPTSLDNLHLTNLNLSNNQFTFAGMETIIPAVINITYSPQAIIPINKSGAVLSVSAGGSMYNETYNWYKNGAIVATQAGDSTFTPTISGTYSVTITDTSAVQLTLQSDTIYVLMQDSTNNPIDSINNSSDTLSVIAAYPNPAHGIATLVFNESTAGQYIITIRNVSTGSVSTVLEGESAAGQNVIYQNIQNYAPGMYVITLIDSTGRHHFKLDVE